MPGLTGQKFVTAGVLEYGKSKRRDWTNTLSKMPTECTLQNPYKREPEQHRWNSQKAKDLGGTPWEMMPEGTKLVERRFSRRYITWDKLPRGPRHNTREHSSDFINVHNDLLGKARAKLADARQAVPTDTHGSKRSSSFSGISWRLREQSSCRTTGCWRRPRGTSDEAATSFGRGDSQPGKAERCSAASEVSPGCIQEELRTRAYRPRDL